MGTMGTMIRVLIGAAAFSLASMVAVVGCSGGEGAAGGDFGSGADAAARWDAGSSGADAGSSVADAGSSVADAGSSVADGGFSENAGSAGDAGGVVVITGVVSSLASSGKSTPLAAATVEIVGASPAKATTSDADGAYSLSVVPGTYFVRASKQSKISAQLGIVTSVSTVVDELGLLGTAAAAVMALQAGQSIDKKKGILAVSFETTDTGGGYGVALGGSITHGTPIALDARGNPTESETTLKDAYSALIVLNVSPGATTVTLTAPSGHACTASPPMTEFRFDADVVTAVIAKCN